MAGLPNYFISSLAQTLAIQGNETQIELSTIYTLDGQIVDTADFAQFGRGILTLDPIALQSTEFASFTAVDPALGTSGGVTGVLRGLSFKGNNQIPANQKFHVVGSPVLISWGTHNISDVMDVINNNYNSLVALINAIVIGQGIPATSTDPGLGFDATQSEVDAGTPDKVWVPNGLTYPIFVSPATLNQTLLNKGLIPTVISLPTGENIAQNDALALIDTYTPGGNITLDNKTISNSASYSFTVGNNINRLLILAVSVNGATGVPDVSNVSFNGVNMTNIGSSFVNNNGYSHSQRIYLFKMIAPPIGTYSINITYTGFLDFSAIHSYYNVDQTVGVDVVTTSNLNGTTQLTTTTLVNNAVIFGAFAAVLGIFGISNRDIEFDGTPTANLQTNFGGAAWSGDSGIITIPQAVLGDYIFNSSGSSSDNLHNCIQCSIKPATTSILAVVKTDPTVTTKINFIGFAMAAALQDTQVSVNIGTIDDSFTSLTPLQNYYLSDTPGLISATPGTIPLAVGRALSDTTMLFNNQPLKRSGVFTVSTTGTTTIDVGFRISKIRFHVISGTEGATNIGESFGESDGVNNQCIGRFTTGSISSTTYCFTYNTQNNAYYTRGICNNVTSTTVDLVVTDNGGSTSSLPLQVFWEAES